MGPTPGKGFASASLGVRRFYTLNLRCDMCNLQSNKVVVWQDESLAQVPAMNYDMNFPLSLKIKMQPYLTSSDI